MLRRRQQADKINARLLGVSESSGRRAITGTCLILGGHGFVGSAVSTVLSDAGWDITVAGRGDVQQLAGSRPATPDRKPLIGSIPNWEGLYLATGHTARGVHLSFITAKMIHDSILGSDNQQLFDYAAFSPARFNTSRELDHQEDSPIFEG